MNLNIKQIYTRVTCRMFKINIKIQQTSPKSILVLHKQIIKNNIFIRAIRVKIFSFNQRWNMENSIFYLMKIFWPFLKKPCSSLHRYQRCLFSLDINLKYFTQVCHKNKFQLTKTTWPLKISVVRFPECSLCPCR